MFEDKACKHAYEHGGAQFAAGMKVTTVKDNRQVEQRGPTQINQKEKWRHHPQHERKINVYSNQHPFKHERRRVLINQQIISCLSFQA
jgi:predicted adenine nucleotide alpha hydrolase (AANH) superfamily ATPase